MKDAIDTIFDWIMDLHPIPRWFVGFIAVGLACFVFTFAVLSPLLLFEADLMETFFDSLYNGIGVGLALATIMSFSE